MATKKFQLSSIKSFILQVLFNGYEKDKVDLYLNDKIAYDKGFRYFKGRFPNLTNSFKHNLSHCQGLAEISRKDGDLLKYSFYKYRQYELLMFEIFESNNEVVNKGDSKHYNRVKILNFLGKSNWTLQRIKRQNCINKYSLVKDVWEVKVKNSVNSISVNTKAGNASFKTGETIGEIASKKPDINRNLWVYRVQIGDTIKVPFVDVDLDRVTVPTDENGYIKFENLITDRDKHFLFQRAFYFDLKGGVRGNVKPCQLNAYYSMRHYRDLYSHNKFFSMVEINKSTPEDLLYMEDPELILTSDYYDRLILSFIQAYDDFLKHPHF